MKDLKFNYLSRPSLPCFNDVGTSERKVFELVEKGNNRSLRYVRSFDIQKKIQSYHDGCALSSLLKKFSMSGDAAVLIRGSGFYGDTSGLPTDPQEVINNMREAGRIFSEIGNAAADQKVGSSLQSNDFASEIGKTTESEVKSDAE